MAPILDRLARYASPILIVVGALLAGGVVAAMLGQMALGWSAYVVGYAGALLAFVAVAGLQQRAMGALGWGALAILLAGVVLGLPALLMLLGYYAEIPFLHDLFRSYAGTPFGILSGVFFWLGIALFAVAIARGADLPRGAAILMIAAALLAVPVELRLVRQPYWAGATIMLFAALTWIAIVARQQRYGLVWKS